MMKVRPEANESSPKLMFTLWVEAGHVVATFVLLNRSFALYDQNKESLDRKKAFSRHWKNTEVIAISHTFGQGRVFALIQSR